MLALAIFAGFSLLNACGRAYSIPTDAMKPTLTREDMAIADPNAYRNGTIQRFDIVVFEMPESEKTRVGASGGVRQIKRVVGLPGETIEINNDQLLVNGVIIKEPFEKIVSEKDRKRNFGPVNIPDDEYFLLGDNRPESLDSRYFVPPTIKRSAIYSKIVDVKKGYYAK
jgi:signal peptidase I